MSFARRGDDSSVHVYQNHAGDFVCSGCWLTFGQSFPVPGAALMVAHLRRHLERGDLVPAHTIEDLQAVADGAPGCEDLG